MILSIEENYLSSVIQRFNNFIEKTDNCWKWNGALITSGYGSIWVRNRNHPAHRISWIIHRGSIQKGLLVLHTCDNRFCTNPNHLFLGTNKENSQDMINKGRSARGEKSGVAKITNEQRLKIIERYFINKEKQKDIAAAYNITPPGVRYILKLN